MNKRRILTLIISLTMSIWSFSQEKPQIVWKEKVHNFNQVNSKDSLVETFFFFDVKGKVPLVIHNISVGCGCTAVDWIKRPIKPGEKGYVKVIFHPKDQNGYFDKKFIIESNAQKKTDLLRIKGYVK